MKIITKLRIRKSYLPSYYAWWNSSGFLATYQHSLFLLLLPIDCHCSNLSGNGANKSGLQVNAKTDSNAIEFCLNLHIMNNDISNLIEGSAAICFSIEKTIPLQIKLLPITMQFNFSDEQKSKQFQQKLAKNFKGWLLHQNESDYIPIKLDEWRSIQIDFWVFPILHRAFSWFKYYDQFHRVKFNAYFSVAITAFGFSIGFMLSECYEHLCTD